MVHRPDCQALTGGFHALTRLVTAMTEVNAAAVEALLLVVAQRPDRDWRALSCQL